MCLRGGEDDEEQSKLVRHSSLPLLYRHSLLSTFLYYRIDFRPTTNFRPTAQLLY
jgi:hypothetical protein